MVDDNADLQKHIRSLIEIDFHVEEAHNGRADCARARDLVMMPELGGFNMV